MSLMDIIGDFCGFFTIVAAIFLLNAFKDMKITWRNIPTAKNADSIVDDGDLAERNLGINGVNNSNYIVDCRDMEARIARNMSSECITRTMSDDSDCNDNYSGDRYHGSSPIQEM